MCSRIKFKLDLTEEEIPNFIGKKVYDSDDRTILGTIDEYDKEAGIAVIKLTEIGYKIIAPEFQEQKNKIGWSIDANYLPDVSEKTITEFNELFINKSS